LPPLLQVETECGQSPRVVGRLHFDILEEDAVATHAAGETKIEARR
jgi:hypothetical protein